MAGSDSGAWRRRAAHLAWPITRSHHHRQVRSSAKRPAMTTDGRRVAIRAATHAPLDLRPLWPGDPRSVAISPLGWHAVEGTPRRTILLLGTVLFVVLGVAALLFAVAMDMPVTARSAPGAVNEAIARRFYDAVNDAVLTGELSFLDQMAVTNTDRMTRAEGTGCDLRCRVSALHQLDPDSAIGGR